MGRTSMILFWVLMVLVACSASQQASGPQTPDTLSLDRLFEEGKAAYRQGNYDEAAQRFADVVQADPQHLKALINWGVALSRSGKPAQAVPKFQQAIERDPRHAAAYYNWGVALERLGKHQEAVGKYERALQLQAELMTPGLQRYLERHRPPAPGNAIDLSPPPPAKPQ